MIRTGIVNDLKHMYKIDSQMTAVFSILIFKPMSTRVSSTGVIAYFGLDFPKEAKRRNQVMLTKHNVYDTFVLNPTDKFSSSKMRSKIKAINRMNTFNTNY